MPPSVSVAPPVPIKELKKATINEVHLAVYRDDFVLGEPVVLRLTAVSPHQDSDKVYENHPAWIPLELVLETQGKQRVYSLLGKEHVRIYQPLDMPKAGATHDRVEMWGTPLDSGLRKIEPLFPKPGKYRIIARFQKEEPKTTIDSNTVEITIRAPNFTESRALSWLKEGAVLWAAFVRLGPAEADRAVLERLAKQFPDTPYAPYCLFALTQDIDEGNILGSNEPVPKDMYARFLVSYWAAERLIEKYPKFCLRDDAYYRLLKSWGFMPMVKMWEINAKDPKQAVGHVRSFVGRSERFLKDYPRSPYVQEVRKLLGPARDYVRKHGG